MIYLALKEELKGHNVVIGSVKPGVVNTPLLVTHSIAPQTSYLKLILLTSYSNRALHLRRPIQVC